MSDQLEEVERELYKHMRLRAQRQEMELRHSSVCVLLADMKGGSSGGKTCSKCVPGQGIEPATAGFEPLLDSFNLGSTQIRRASTPCEHELVSVKAQCLHSDELEEEVEEEGERKPCRNRERGERDCACSGERKAELRQRHARDVTRLPQAEGRGGVVELWRSAERSEGERKGDKAGGEEARNHYFVIGKLIESTQWQQLWWIIGRSVNITVMNSAEPSTACLQGVRCCVLELSVSAVTRESRQIDTNHSSRKLRGTIRKRTSGRMAVVQYLGKPTSSSVPSSKTHRKGFLSPVSRARVIITPLEQKVRASPYQDLKQQLYKSLLNFLAMPGVANGASDILAESRLVSVEDSVPGTGSLHCNQEQNEGYCVCVWLMSASRWEYIDNCRLVTISWCSIRISSGNQESYENLKVLKINLIGHRKRILASLGDRLHDDTPQKPPRAISLREPGGNHTPPQLSPSVGQAAYAAGVPGGSLDVQHLIMQADARRRQRSTENYFDDVPRSKLERQMAQVSMAGEWCEPITLRPPNEATSSTPVQYWQHHPEKLIFQSCDYEAYVSPNPLTWFLHRVKDAHYLGSMLVKELRGTESTQDACAKMRKSTEQMKKVPTIILSVSYKGVKFIDATNKNIIAEHEIRNISCAAQDPEDLSTFAYITKDLKSSHHYCHVFTAFDVNLAYEIILTLGQAFEVAYQLALQARKSGHGSATLPESFDNKPGKPVPKPRVNIRKSVIMSPSNRWSLGHIYTPHRPPLHPPLPPPRLFHLPYKAHFQMEQPSMDPKGHANVPWIVEPGQEAKRGANTKSCPVSGPGPGVGHERRTPPRRLTG
ncbi:hypothetical protein CCH79_00015252, partial [Gambusia affinis]